MGSSAMLRVLIVGNNPNLMLYTSRFQLAKSVELYHVSDSKSNAFTVETKEYGSDQFQLENHFTSIAHLIEALKQSSEHSSIIFDMIVLSAASLQEISSSASHLNPMININTKLFLESSGFVQLEPFVKMSLDLPKLNIFSITTDYDIRQVGPNHYRQFGEKAASSIYLGESSFAKQQQQQQQQNSKTSPANSSSSLGQLAAKYPKNLIALLDTFQRLFEKLFPHDKISLCSYSAAEFVSQQWALAIPKICFEPLLILFEETNPSELHQHILAKPLISGLVTEVITVMKSMGAKLNANMENETSLLSHWQRMFSDPNETPSLVYHFSRRTASLDTDMLLLQPILLADDYGIKTPYLEFLYSLMCQYQKLNEGKSKWFARIEDQQDVKSKLKLVEGDKTRLIDDITILQKSVEEKDALARQLQADDQNSKRQIQVLQSQLGSSRQEIATLMKRHEMELQRLRDDRTVMTNGYHQKPEDGNQWNEPEMTTHDQYGPTGTPNLRDIEDVALYGVNYGDSPLKERLQQPTPPPTSGSLNSSDSRSGSGSGPENDKTLKERELEIRKRELDLQERELELQRRAVQQQQPQQPRHVKGQKQTANAVSPTLGNRKSSFNHLQQASNIRSNRSMHGAAPIQNSSAGNFVDPASAVGHRQASGIPNPANTPMGPMPPQAHHQHSIKPTSRKNRNSNMAIIGNASSLGLNNFGRPPATSQTRLNSLSTGNLNIQPRLRQQSSFGLNNNGSNSNPRLNMPEPVNSTPSPLNNQPGSAGSNSQPLEFQPQRQFSSSTTIQTNGMNPNVSMNSVVHNPMGDQSDNTQRPIQISTQMASPPQINVNGPESSPSTSSAGFHSSDANDESGELTGESSPPTNENKKDKKKKFGLFGKKSKSKK